MRLFAIHAFISRRADAFIQASDAYLVHLMNSSMPEAQAAPFISVILELISMHITLVSNLLSHLPSVRAKTHLE